MVEATGGGYKGMLQVAENGGKNIVEDLQDYKMNWKKLLVPELLIQGLHKIKYDYPSRIQSASLKNILGDTTKNYFFQAGNG